MMDAENRGGDGYQIKIFEETNRFEASNRPFYFFL